MSKQSISRMLMSRWEALSRIPGGSWLFSKILGFTVPYTGALGAKVTHLEPGYCIVALKDRRGVRNHLKSIHAIALANLAEVSTGLAVLSGMPEDARGILAGIEIEYRKKARGTLTASCQCEIPSVNTKREYQIIGEIYDAEKDLVASAKARWLIGPIE